MHTTFTRAHKDTMKSLIFLVSSLVNIIGPPSKHKLRRLVAHQIPYNFAFIPSVQCCC